MRVSRTRSDLCAVFLSLFTLSAMGMPSAASAEDMIDLPQDLEIELALSALPERLQADSTVYRLDPSKGYVLHREGKNGFATFVARTSIRFYSAAWPYSYPADQLIPMAFDSVGIEHHMRPWFAIAKMRAEGVSAKDAKTRLQRDFRDGFYKAPVKGGLSYMLAPIHRAYMAPEASDEMITVSMPHYMPYAPYVTPAQLGNDTPMNGGPFVLNHGGRDSGPHGYMMFMLPTPKADGLRAKYAPLLERLCGLHDNWCLAKEE
ncbi:hypothetical protein [Denitrobaculum tricleocarpae]|uniref:Uncharacterized protein n=1 Tax=Denitrobaculum tricleocarpae TaxID=2591009 RepID=A0A545T098_9PROT|nr:hypothetical protein [Denitrobaculum tricleocarpae]TQV70646.1 hypothetical protein FKG95_27705 [Denitrobaculum tricleocarpae]